MLSDGHLQPRAFQIYKQGMIPYRKEFTDFTAYMERQGTFNHYV